MGDRPLVSIVIPTYNHAAYLKEALQFVINQSLTDWEAIVVNNYSQDNTVEVVESFKDPRIRLVNFSNNGIIAASRNEGIRMASGEWVAFLDSDDKWWPNKLEQCITVVKPEIDVICHGLSIIQNGIPWKTTKSGTVKNITYEKLLFEGNCLATSAVMVKKTSLLQVGCFDEKKDIITAEDYDLWIRLAKFGCRIVTVPDILGEYRWHEGNASKIVSRTVQAEIAVIKKNYVEDPKAVLSKRLRFKHRVALAYYSAARVCYHAGQRKEALEYYWYSIKNYPLLVKAYIGSLQTMFS